VAVAGRDYRASDADREAAAERLRLASVEGRISSEELEQRMAGVYGAVTVAELDRLVIDVLPPPPPPAPVPPPSAYPAPMPQQYVVQPAPTNGLAIASLVASIVWFAWLGSALAVVFGHIALNQINASGGREQGKGLAIAGLVMGYLSLGFLLLIILGAALS
jgi:hypothetical protein